MNTQHPLLSNYFTAIYTCEVSLHLCTCLCCEYYILAPLTSLPNSYLAILCLQLAIGHGESVYTMKIGKHYKPGLGSLLCWVFRLKKVVGKMIIIQIKLETAACLQPLHCEQRKEENTLSVCKDYHLIQQRSHSHYCECVKLNLVLISLSYV